MGVVFMASLLPNMTAVAGSRSRTASEGSKI